ncbi:MAG: ribonuclease III [Bacteroidales bacterium]|nr:ribonuclease III [Bacteroidales bacterium]MDY0140841.1 ribonuclease III [Bacteroidales bacterium]
MFCPFSKKSEADKILVKNLISILGFKPKNLFFYKQALRHASAIGCENNRQSSNERLEFVGDAIISAIVSNILFNHFPKADEGRLSILRSTIVNRKTLNQLADELKIHELMKYKSSSLNVMKNMGGNSFEAIVGAIYYDRGYKYCIKFIENIIKQYFNLNTLIKQNTDYKSRLLQYVQKYKFDLLIDTYENVEQNEKNQHFVTEICINNNYIASGKGWSKKEAEQIASKNVLKEIKTDNKENI